MESSEILTPPRYLILYPPYRIPMWRVATSLNCGDVELSTLIAPFYGAAFAAVAFGRELTPEQVSELAVGVKAWMGALTFCLAVPPVMWNLPGIAQMNAKYRRDKEAFWEVSQM